LADASLDDEHSEAAHTCESPVQMRSKHLQFTLAPNEDGGRRGGDALAVRNGESMAAGAAQAGLIRIELTTRRTYRCHSSSITRITSKRGKPLISSSQKFQSDLSIEYIPPSGQFLDFLNIQPSQADQISLN